jgi:hypothetical protein
MTTKTSRIETTVEGALGSHGDVVAYMAGHKFVRFAPVERASIAAVFADGAFPKSAEKLTEITAPDSLAAIVARSGKVLCSRMGRLRSNGHTIAFSLDKLETDDPTVKSWGLYRAERPKGERGSKPRIGARVFARPDGTIGTAPPVDEPEDPDCMALADQIAAEAQAHLSHADASDVSVALVQAYTDAGCYSFLARGLYIAEAGREATARLVKLVDAVRGAFWNEAERRGVRCRTLAVTRQDEAAVSDAVLDDLERKVADLVADLRRCQASSDTVRLSTLVRRQKDSAAILADLDRHKALLGQWTDKFSGQAESLRRAFQAAVDGAVLELPAWAEGIESPEDSGETGVSPVAPEATPNPPAAPAQEADSELSVFDL